MRVTVVGNGGGYYWFQEGNIMNWKFTFGICGLSLLSGCHAVEGLRPDIAARPVPSRMDEIAYINVLRSAFTVQDGTKMESGAFPADGICFDGNGLKEFRAKSAQGFRDTAYNEEHFGDGKCIVFKDNPNPEELRHYLTAGFGLTDLYCQRFFTVANASEQNRKFGRNVASGVDVMIGSILSLSGAGDTAVGIANAGFGLLDTTFESYDTAYLVAPDMSNVQKLVLAAQDEYRKEALSSESPVKGYPGGRSAVERYATICTFSGMRELVNKSLKDKTDAINKDTNDKGKDGKPADKALVEKATDGKPVPANSPIGQSSDRLPTTLVPVG